MKPATLLLKRGAALKSRRRRDIRLDRELAAKVGGHLLRVRTRLGVSQNRWAECADVTRAQLSNIEAGRCLPSLALIYRLAHAIAVSPRELLP